MRPERIMLQLAWNAWHAVGPGLVLALAGEGPPSLSSWPLYTAALLAQFAVDFAVSTVREWIVLGLPPAMHVRAMASVYLIDAGLAPVGLAVAFAAADSPCGVVLALPLIVLLAFFSRDRRVRIDSELELRDAYRGTVFLLGDVVEADDNYTGAHSREVVDLALRSRTSSAWARRSAATRSSSRCSTTSARCGSRTRSSTSPASSPSRSARSSRRHTIEGERMLHRVGGLLGEIGRLVRSCHERWDGTGYPDGLAGEEIPLVARIVCCCDAFNAMTTDRSYRKALPVEAAMAEVERCSGTQFDPRVVEALFAVETRTSLAALARNARLRRLTTRASVAVC